jgi:hypothetical protein
MNNELEPGCLAIIIESVFGQSVGQIVQCIRIRGQHSLYGTVWAVRSQSELVSEYGAKGHNMDVPAKWLKKISPDDLQTKTDKNLELTTE